MTEQHAASELAQAVATQAVTAEHGDNDPRATLDLELRVGIGGHVDQRVPRLPDPPADQPLCWAWGGTRVGERP